MKKVELEIYGIAPSHINGSYSLILNETLGNRKLPVIIGQLEAHAIAIPLEGIQVDRPLTHDLIVSLSKKFHFTISEIYLYQLKEGVFYSQLICVSNENEQIIIESRTSDAIALAVRFNCPIYTTEDIMENAAIEIEEQSIQKPGRDSQNDKKEPQNLENNLFANKTLEELENLLDEALRNEDYMKAAIIRDEIDKKSK